VSGYTPAFREMYMGSLYGRWPAAPVWASLLPLCDKNGLIDMSPQAISGMTGWPLELLVEGIRQLMEPDPNSRTPDDDGRRLVPIDAARPWGWRAVNHGKYREKARKSAWDADRTASGRDAERKRESRRVPTCPDVSRLSPLSDSDTNTDTDKNLPTGGARKRATRRCPDDWKPSQEDVAKISRECPDVDMAAAERKFRDHEFAKARSDWSACWRNWMRTDQERAGKAGKPRLSRYEELMARVALPAPATEPNPFLIGGKL
jgi:hypothetical protein